MSLAGNRSLVFRISLLDTDVYQAQDVPSSPQHAPHPRPELPSPAHAEWVRRTVQRLRSQFPPPHSLLLVNVEKRAKYPFVLFGSPGPRYSASAGPIMPTAATSALSHELRITDGNSFHFSLKTLFNPIIQTKNIIRFIFFNFFLFCFFVCFSSFLAFLIRLLIRRVMTPFCRHFVYNFFPGASARLVRRMRQCTTTRNGRFGQRWLCHSTAWLHHFGLSNVSG